MKKIVYILLAIFILGSINTVFAQDDAFFKIYPANSKYNGEIVLPEGYRKEEGMIFNNINKAVDLTINYNGKYSIVRNSCGGGCVYLTVVDLSTGEVDEDILANYNTNEMKSMEIDGKRYISIPLSKKESTGIIMKYIPEIDEEINTCYEQKFTIEKGTLKELSKITQGDCI